MTLAALQSYMRVSSYGTVKTLGVSAYWDENYTILVTDVDWGMLDPGSSNNVTIYLRNDGNIPINLTLSAENWNPTNASEYISFSWNYNGTPLNPNEVLRVTLTLDVDVNINGITDFRFEIIITGREV